MLLWLLLLLLSAHLPDGQKGFLLAVVVVVADDVDVDVDGVCVCVVTE